MITNLLKWKLSLLENSISKDVIDNQFRQSVGILILLRTLSPRGYLTHEHYHLNLLGWICSFSYKNNFLVQKKNALSVPLNFLSSL